MTRRKRRTYTAKQRADAVRLVRERRAFPQVATDLELTQSSLRIWVKQAEIDGGQGWRGLTDH